MVACPVMSTLGRSSSEPRVGIVGYGEIAQFHARHLVAAGARVVGAVTRRMPADGLVRYASLEAMLPRWTPSPWQCRITCTPAPA